MASGARMRRPRFHLRGAVKLLLEYFTNLCGWIRSIIIISHNFNDWKARYSNWRGVSFHGCFYIIIHIYSSLISLSARFDYYLFSAFQRRGRKIIYGLDERGGRGRSSSRSSHRRGQRQRGKKWGKVQTHQEIEMRPNIVSTRSLLSSIVLVIDRLPLIIKMVLEDPQVLNFFSLLLLFLVWRNFFVLLGPHGLCWDRFPNFSSIFPKRIDPLSAR